MVARLLQRRLASCFHRIQFRAACFEEGVAWSFPFSKRTPLNSYVQLNNESRGLKTLVDPAIEPKKDAQDNEPKLSSGLAETKPESIDASFRFKATSNFKASTRHDLAMIFTCKVCETRSLKTVCRESYEKGVVVARCDGCNNLHLIADHLGWFGEPGTVEELLAARGEEVRKGSLETLNLTLEDLVGTTAKGHSD